jgi:hypothetical protein
MLVAGKEATGIVNLFQSDDINPQGNEKRPLVAVVFKVLPKAGLKITTCLEAGDVICDSRMTTRIRRHCVAENLIGL